MIIHSIFTFKIVLYTILHLKSCRNGNDEWEEIFFFSIFLKPPNLSCIDTQFFLNDEKPNLIVLSVKSVKTLPDSWNICWNMWKDTKINNGKLNFNAAIRKKILKLLPLRFFLPHLLCVMQISRLILCNLHILRVEIYWISQFCLEQDATLVV